MVRERVWFTLMSMISHEARFCSSRDCSRIRSKTTIVSLIE